MTTMFTLDAYRVENPPTPGTPEWARTVTASKVPPMIRKPNGDYAGFGYLTAWQQYMELEGHQVEEINDYMEKRFAAAHKAEEVAINWWLTQQDNPEDWGIEREVAYHNPLYHLIGFATLDAVATHLPTGEQHCIEIKNPDNPGLQPGWMIQHHTQRMCSNLQHGGIIVFPRKGAPEYHPITWDQGYIDNIYTDVTHFQELRKAGTPPPGGDLTLTDEDMDQLDKALAAVADAEKQLEEVRAKLIDKLGDCKRAIHDGKVVFFSGKGRFAQGRIPKEYKDLAKDEKYYTTSKKFDADKFAKDYPDAYAAALGETSYTFR